MILTDTHTHLYIEAFDEDRDEVIGKALAAGIERFFLPAIDSTYTERMLELQRAYPEHIYLMAGLHPTHVKGNYEEELAKVVSMLETHRIHAVGETGIDLYWDRTYFQEQLQAFRFQIALAKKHGLPVVIHCRESFDEIFEVLEEMKGDTLRGIFHCFTGTREQAEKAIGYNMKLGIGGVVTYRNGQIDAFLDAVDLGNIVLETDSPYLAPVPYRGKRNESAYLIPILHKVSEIYGKPPAEVAGITTANSREIFGI